MEETLKIFTLVLTVVLIILTFVYRNKIKQLKRFGYLGIFLISLASSISIVSAAGPMVTIAGGTMYNVWLVGLIAALGSSIGDILPYNLGTSGTSSLQQHSWFATIDKYMDRYGGLTVFLMAAVPNPFFDVASVAAGLSNFGLLPFLIVSFAGKILKYTFFAYVGMLAFKRKNKHT
jgi:membrane protein YqaA with SNARE-associated domain